MTQYKFEKLPTKAQEIAHKIMAENCMECDILKELDNSKEFREAVQSDKYYMKEVDYVMEYWRLNRNNQ